MIRRKSKGGMGREWVKERKRTKNRKGKWSYEGRKKEYRRRKRRREKETRRGREVEGIRESKRVEKEEEKEKMALRNRKEGGEKKR